MRKAAEGAIRLASKKKDWPREREPFQLEALRAWLETPRASSPFLHTRDAALVILGFRAMLRPGELAALKMEDVRKTIDGGLQVRIGVSKADQKAERRPILITPTGSKTCPVSLVEELVELRRSQGALGGDRLFVSEKGTHMSVPGISAVVARMAREAGLNGKFSGHSLRIGGASAALEGGLSVDEIKTAGAWKSDAVNLYLIPKSLSARVGKAMGL